MKKRHLTVAAIVALAGSMMFTSCIGSFNLTNKLLAWNKTIGNKFLNELVFIAFWVLPVYEVSGLADIIVLNSIEFWSGSNPVAQGKSIIEGNDGHKYLVDCDGKGYTITCMSDNSQYRLDLNEDTREWSTEINGENVVFMTFVDDTHVKLPTRSGDEMIVETSEAGLFAYQAVNGYASDLALK